MSKIRLSVPPSQEHVTLFTWSFFVTALVKEVYAGLCIIGGKVNKSVKDKIYFNYNLTRFKDCLLS